MQDRPRPGSVLERYWIYEFTLEEPPMTAWGVAQYKSQNRPTARMPFPSRKQTIPSTTVHSDVDFRAPIFMHFPFRLFSRPGEVIMLFEWDSLRHQIFTDGRGHTNSLGPLWMGDAIGHWEGDTLVADTVNFNEKTWLDRIGHPHSDDAARDRAHPARRSRSSGGRHYHRRSEGLHQTVDRQHRIRAEAEMDFVGRVLRGHRSFEDIEKQETTPAK